MGKQNKDLVTVLSDRAAEAIDGTTFGPDSQENQRTMASIIKSTFSAPVKNLTRSIMNLTKQVESGEPFIDPEEVGEFKGADDNAVIGTVSFTQEISYNRCRYGAGACTITLGGNPMDAMAVYILGAGRMKKWASTREDSKGFLVREGLREHLAEALIKMAEEE